MKILCFGGSGFIGQYVVKELVKQGHEVVNADINNYSDGEYEYIDISNSVSVYRVIYDIRPEVIYNFAAISDIGQCSENPELSYIVNIQGNHNILKEVSCYKKPPKYIYASSLYALNTGSGMYGISKKVSEDLIKFYSKRFNFPYVIMRFGSIYGIGASKENGIRNLIESALKNNVISYYGTGEEIRNHIHVSDVAKASVSLLDKKHNNFTWVIKGKNSIRGKDLCKIISEITGIKDIYFRGEVPPDHYHSSPYRYDWDLTEIYDLKNSIDFGEGLMSIVHEQNKK